MVTSWPPSAPASASRCAGISSARSPSLSSAPAPAEAFEEALDLAQRGREVGLDQPHVGGTAHERPELVALHERRLAIAGVRQLANREGAGVRDAVERADEQGHRLLPPRGADVVAQRVEERLQGGL